MQASWIKRFTTPTSRRLSLTALAHVGTARSQRTLVELASLESQPLELRKLAADSFATSRERFGVLLTAEEIALQYDRYNASETATAEVQASARPDARHLGKANPRRAAK